MRIDLHMVKHEDVSRRIDMAIWEAMKGQISQLTIITGNSEKMKSLVRECASEYGFICNQNINNGVITIDLI